MLDGLILLNKPTGVSSRYLTSKVLAFDRKLKTGHVGTLDPLASGLLPVLIGRATKLQDFLLGSTKIYEFIVEFGAVTETLDSESSVMQVDPEFELPSEIEVNRILQKFIGGYVQSPPLYSAVKKNGVSLHKLARGEKKSLDELEQIASEASKRVEIFSLSLVEIYSSRTAKFRVECGKGCYVRSLARDIACEFNTKAYCKGICRLSTARYELKDAMEAESFSSVEAVREKLVPLNQIKLNLPSIQIPAQTDWIDRYLNGIALPLSSLQLHMNIHLDEIKDKKMFFITTDAGEMLGLSAVYEINGNSCFRLKRRI